LNEAFGFAKDHSRLKISPRDMRHGIHPASLCPKPHGLPCLTHRKVIQGLLKPCAICEPYLPMIRGNLETQAILRQQEIEKQDAAACELTQAHIEAENSIIAIAKLNRSPRC
jgi:hypothetical protein